MIDEESNHLVGLISKADLEHVEKRKLFFFTLNYYWLNKEAFLRSKHYISILMTHDQLPEKEYFLKISNKTFLIDLSKTKEEIFSTFDNKGARYSIRKALKSGVIVKRAESAAEKQKFYDFYQAFVGHPKRKNKMLILQKEELDRLDIFYATSAEGAYLGGIGLLPSPDKHYLLYKYAATLHKLCENELMLWHAIQYAKDLNYSFFDMSCVYPTSDKNSDRYRLYQFKKKFGGNIVDFYTYVQLRGPFFVLGLLFNMILKYLFMDDFQKFTLFLRRIRVFK